MDQNPYQSPVASRLQKRPRAKWWGWLAFIGIVISASSLMAILAIGEIHQTGMSFRSAWLAMTLFAMFCGGAIVMIGGGIGWLTSRLWGK